MCTNNFVYNFTIFEKKYILEYGENSLSIQKKALRKYDSYAIVDDLLATGGTAKCVYELLEGNNKKILGLVVVAELLNLNARSTLNFPVESIVTF